MQGFETMGRMLLIFGAMIFLLGLIMIFAGKIPFVGRLPGDIHIQRKNFAFYFPIVTCIVLSILLTIILNLIGLIFRR